MDPLTSSYAMLTPYQFAHNSPIVAIDRDGLEAESTTEDEIFSFQSDEIVVTANASSDQEIERYDGANTTWGTYQKMHGLEGWSQANYTSYYYSGLSSEKFERFVQEEDSNEAARVTVEKLAMFLAFFKGIEDYQYVLGGGSAGLTIASVKASRILGGRVIQSSVTGNALISGNAKWGMGGKLNYFNLTPTPKGFSKINPKFGKSGYDMNCADCTFSTNRLIQFNEFIPAGPAYGRSLSSIEAQYGSKFNGEYLTLGELQSSLIKLPNNTSVGIAIYRGHNRMGHILNGQVHSGLVKILDAQPIPALTYPLSKLEPGLYQFINLTGKRGFP